MGRATAWQLFGTSEALPSAMYALKPPDAWWLARVSGMSNLSGADTTAWSPMPKLKLFQNATVNFVTGGKLSANSSNQPESRLSPANLAALPAMKLVFSVSRNLSLRDRTALASSRALIRPNSCSISFCLRFLQAAAYHKSYIVNIFSLASDPNMQLSMNQLTATEQPSGDSMQPGALCPCVLLDLGPG